MNDLYLEVFSDLPGVKAFFATKYGASQGSPYYHEEVIQSQGLEQMCLIWPKQVHKDHIEIVKNAEGSSLTVPETDGAITDEEGVLLTTVHADCLPVYFFDPVKRAIGLVHAGWRGTALGIGAKAVRMMADTYGSKPEDIRAYIGPGISKCCFEVGSEVYEEFKKCWSFADEFAETGASGTDGTEGKYYLDLKGINRRQLQEAGLKDRLIESSSHCTCCEPELFCSYRREGGTYMRMGAGLCLLPFEGE